MINVLFRTPATGLDIRATANTHVNTMSIQIFAFKTRNFIKRREQPHNVHRDVIWDLGFSSRDCKNHAIVKESGDLNKHLQGVISRDAASIPWLILLASLHSILLELTW